MKKICVIRGEKIRGNLRESAFQTKSNAEF